MSDAAEWEWDPSLDELRELLRQASPDGLFSEQMREIAIDIWHA